MKKYIVGMREIHIQNVEIEAESPEEAIERVADGEGDFVDNSLEYSHTLNTDTWTVKEKKG